MTANGSVYISALAAFLPNEPVDNEAIEDVLGLIGDVPSSTKSRILRSNGILTRYYAIDPVTGERTHTSAELTAEAVRRLMANSQLEMGEVDCLVCGTTTPDQWIPNHALMVQGELGAPPMEVVSTAGVCASGITAMKYAAMSVLTGSARRAVSTATEASSSVLEASRFQPAPGATGRRMVPFEKEFLRWMLSDGAGAALLTPEARPGGVSLRIEWIDIVSYAGELETCMYWGGAKEGDGSLRGWRSADGPEDAARHGMFNVAQDAKLLNREIVTRSVDHAFQDVVKKRGLTPDEVDWFTPHYSSEFFRPALHERFEQIGFPIPFEKWFTNLTSKGNTGSASIYIILEELMSSGRLRAGEKILCFIPESARFTVAYMLLTVVESD